MTHYTVNPGDTIQLGAPPSTVATSPTPPDIWGFLNQRGWAEYGGAEDRWKHDGKKRFSLTWEQAMACEFFEFITLGGK